MMEPHPNGYPIKLVRDNTPAIINATGEPGDLYYVAGAEDMDRLLRLKLAEEVTEFIIDGGWNELRDVLAVVEALAERADHGGLSALTASMRADPRGGFRRGVMMFGRHSEYDR